MLTGLRFLQGLAGGAGIVIGRAVVRDLYSGAAAARLFSSLMLVTGLAPILAPVIGAQVLKVTDWQGIFVVLAALALAIVTLAAVALPGDAAAGPGATAAGWRTRSGRSRPARAALVPRLRADRRRSRSARCSPTSPARPFVLQEVYGLSPQAFSLAFGANGLGPGGRQPDQRAARRALRSGLPARAARCW